MKSTNNFYTLLAVRTIILGFQTFYFLPEHSLEHCIIEIKTCKKNSPQNQSFSQAHLKYNQSNENYSLSILKQVSKITSPSSVAYELQLYTPTVWIIMIWDFPEYNSTRLGCCYRGKGENITSKHVGGHSCNVQESCR